MCFLDQKTGYRFRLTKFKSGSCQTLICKRQLELWINGIQAAAPTPCTGYGECNSMLRVLHAQQGRAVQLLLANGGGKQLADADGILAERKGRC